MLDENLKMENKIEYATPELAAKLKKVSLILMPIYTVLLLIPYPAQTGTCAYLSSMALLVSIPLTFGLLVGIMVFIRARVRKFSPDGLLKSHLVMFYTLIILSPVDLIIFKNYVWIVACEFWAHVALGIICYVPFWVWATRWINKQFKPSEGGK